MDRNLLCPCHLQQLSAQGVVAREAHGHCQREDFVLQTKAKRGEPVAFT